MPLEKSHITPALVRELVSTQFPAWADLPVRPVALDGWDNTSFRLGDEMVVRLPSAERYAAQVEKEQQWLPRLASHLPLPVPQPLALGEPAATYPFRWSVYRWLPGEPAATAPAADLNQFANDLAGFLNALYRVETLGGPLAGAHSFFRGGPVATYDAETRAAIMALAGIVDTAAALAVWDAAVSAPVPAKPVWVQGDVAPSNLLIVHGRLSAVIDFGCMAVGDPACDLVMAWTFFENESRRTFREAIGLDQATWARARGWALWKATITLARELRSGRTGVETARWGWRLSAQEVIGAVLADARGQDVSSM